MKIQKILILILICLSFNSNTLFPTTPDEAYYQSNQWDFLEEKLITQAKTPQQIRTAKLVNSIFIFIIGSALTSLPTSFIIEKLNADYIYFLLVSCLGGLISAILCNKYINYNYHSVYDACQQILDNYHPDTNKFENNTKKYIPEELHQTFDLIYQQYKRRGKCCLINQTTNVINLIRDKIMNQIKPNKYSKAQNPVYVLYCT